MLKEFKEFALKGSVLDLAIGLILGTAFGKVVSSLVDDILMPPIGFLIGNVDFANLFIPLTSSGYATLAEAKAAGVPTINYGLFLNSILTFLVVAFAMFLVIRRVNRMRREPEKESPAVKECPQCLSTIPAAALRCRDCATLF